MKSQYLFQLGKTVRTKGNDSLTGGPFPSAAGMLQRDVV